MSEHDYWQVESSVYGGVGYAPATLEEYVAIAKALDDEAAGFAAIATAWESAALQLQSHRHSAPMCVTLQSGDPSAVVPGHVTAPYAALGNRCYDHATACQRLSDDLRGAADLLIRAHSLYSQAEMTARRMFTELLQAGTQAKPGYAAVGVAAVAAGGFLAGWTIDGKPNSAWMSTFTYPFQEGVLSGAGWCHPCSSNPGRFVLPPGTHFCDRPRNVRALLRPVPDGRQSRPLSTRCR